MKRVLWALVLASCGGEEIEPGLVVQDLGEATLTFDPALDLPVAAFAPELPAGTLGAVIELDYESPDASAGIFRLSGPLGPLIDRDADEIPAQRDLLVGKRVTSLLPSAPEVPLVSGPHRLLAFDLAADRTVRGRAVYKVGPLLPDDGTVDVRLWLAGVEGVSADTANADPRLQAMWAGASSLLSQAGLRFGARTVVDVADPALHEIDISGDEPTRLYAVAPPGDVPRIELFLVRRLSRADGSPLAGTSANVAGPVFGAGRAGVIVSAEDLSAEVPPDVDPRSSGPRFVGFVLAHELLHYLGLFHTTEASFTWPNVIPFDPLRDTPLCGPEQDADGDGVLRPSECEAHGLDNVMFWAGRRFDVLDRDTPLRLTRDQGETVRRSPLVR